jgi:hypothetical protein
VIIVRLMGGLGNQMFQYATALRLAHANETEVKIDLSWYLNNNQRRFELGCFRIKESFVTHAEMARLPKIPKSRIRSVLNRLFTRIRKCGSYNIVRESKLSFNSRIMSLPDNVVLIGYWQSYKYFEDIRCVLLAVFRPKKQLSKANEILRKSIEDSLSVGIHVRRGDYVDHRRRHKIHGSCEPDYYRKSIDYIAGRVQNPDFFVFSDDINWARQNLSISRDARFVDLNSASDDWMDMVLMSHCKHNIIANSSFSWWAAWLNQNPDKIVVGPSKYYAKEALNKTTEDLFPRDWVRI